MDIVLNWVPLSLIFLWLLLLLNKTSDDDLADKIGGFIGFTIAVGVAVFSERYIDASFQTLSSWIFNSASSENWVGAVVVGLIFIVGATIRGLLESKNTISLIEKEPCLSG
jgi:hypothetical protein